MKRLLLILFVVLSVIPLVAAEDLILTLTTKALDGTVENSFDVNEEFWVEVSLNSQNHAL